MTTVVIFITHIKFQNAVTSEGGKHYLNCAGGETEEKGHWLAQEDAEVENRYSEFQLCTLESIISPT